MSEAYQNWDIDGSARRADPHAMLLDELADFVARHRPCGQLTGDATEPAPEGYLLTVGCSCLRRVPAVGDARGGGDGIGDVGLGDLDELRSAWCDALLC